MAMQALKVKLLTLYRLSSAVWVTIKPVSYTHLDVYKRQGIYTVVAAIVNTIGGIADAIG